MLYLSRSPSLSQDLAQYKATGQREPCFAIAALAAAGGAAQRPLAAAVLQAAGVFGKQSMGRFDKDWELWAKELRAALRPAAAACELAQRIAAIASPAVSGDLAFA